MLYNPNVKELLFLKYISKIDIVLINESLNEKYKPIRHFMTIFTNIINH